MEFAKKVWKLLVAIKDGLSLVFLLLFFGLLFAILTARPNPAAVNGKVLEVMNRRNIYGNMTGTIGSHLVYCKPDSLSPL